MTSIAIILSIILIFMMIVVFVTSIAEQATPILNATDSPFNRTTANLTAYNISSVNATKSIFNWFVDNVSRTLVNLPFEGSSISSRETQDYSGYNNSGIVNGSVWNS